MKTNLKDSQYQRKCGGCVPVGIYIQPGSSPTPSVVILRWARAVLGGDTLGRQMLAGCQLPLELLIE